MKTSISTDILARRGSIARIAAAQAVKKDAVLWAIERWKAEVAHRPLINVHRRSLDDVWRQVIRHFGGDPDALLGPDHDSLLEMDRGRSQ